MTVAATIRGLLVLATLALVPFAGPSVVRAQDTATDAAITLEASGLTNPRGFAWAPDGSLYVALAGTGVPTLTDSATASPGPAALGSDTASVVRIVDGCPVVVASGMGSGGLPELGWVFGLADLAILDDQLYALADGGGEAFGHPAAPNGLYLIRADGTTSLVADLSAWFRANPVAAPHEPINPEGIPYGMVVIDGQFWVVEANHQQVLTITPAGEITRVADLSLLGDVAPDAITAAPGGGVYVGFLSALPFVDGSAKVVHVSSDGVITDVWTGLTAVSAIALDDTGQLYALEMATGNTADPPFIAPGTGRLVRQSGPNLFEVVAEGLDFPVKMKAAPNGDLLIAAPAFGANAGEGTIIRLPLTSDDGRVVNIGSVTGGACGVAGTFIWSGAGGNR